MNSVCYFHFHSLICADGDDVLAALLCWDELNLILTENQLIIISRPCVRALKKVTVKSSLRSRFKVKLRVLPFPLWINNEECEVRVGGGVLILRL